MFQKQDVKEMKTHILYSITVYRKSALYEIMWIYIVEPLQATDGNIIRRVHVACWIPKATNTHSEFVVLIASSLQQWLQERASLLRYTHIACLV